MNYKVIPNGKNNYIAKYTFDSLNEYYDYIIENVECCNGRSSQEVGDGSWAGSRTFEEATELAKYGWKEGLNKLDYQEQSLLYEKYEDEKLLNIEYLTGGAYVDVDRYIQNEPECMVDFINKDKNKFFNIYYNLSSNCSVTATQIFERGKKVLSIVDQLERLGHRVKLTINIISSFCKPEDRDGSENNWNLVVNITAKDYQEVLNIERINFATCSPALLRRFNFALKEIHWEKRGQKFCEWGYGRPLSFKDAHEDIIENIVGDDKYENNTITIDNKTDVDLIINDIKDMLKNDRED